jgi:hypothetical protein
VALAGPAPAAQTAAMCTGTTATSSGAPVPATFLIESSFVALSAIAVGTALGLEIAYNVIVDIRQQPSWQNLEAEALRYQ